MERNNSTLGWGKATPSGSEIWDAEPVFRGEKVQFKDWLKLFFYPKKWFLYNYVKKHIEEMLAEKPQAHVAGWQTETVRILDVGCGTGSDVIDFKKIFGRSVEVIGADIVALQIDLAKVKIKQHGVWAEVKWYDGKKLPFDNNSFDAIYSSGVLGQVKDVPQWLTELNRVLKFGGVMAMFSESKPGKHAFITNYLLKRGLNIDPRAEHHISLYSKSELKDLINKAGFEIENMCAVFLVSFLVHPDEFFGKLQNQPRFPILRFINKVLYRIKMKLRPYSTAVAELYGLIEMYLLGERLETQGYVILAKKK